MVYIIWLVFGLLNIEVLLKAREWHFKGNIDMDIRLIINVVLLFGRRYSISNVICIFN